MKPFKVPETAQEIRRYDELGALVKAFAQGKIYLLVILGRPGLAKSQTLIHATENTDAKIVKGRNSAYKFYELCYALRNQPLVLDDCDSMMCDRLTREMIKILCETDSVKKLRWDTKVAEQDEAIHPTEFETSSPVCLITNSWQDDSISEALESRAEFVYFNPTWHEVYKQASTWFDDQEIFDYLRENIPNMKSPDMRILVKARQRKRANMPLLRWKDVINNHLDDSEGQLVRDLLRDPAYKNNAARGKIYCDKTGKTIQNWYYRVRHLSDLTCPDRIVLGTKS